MQFTVLGVFHFRTKLFCRKYYLQHGFGDPVDLKEGALCAVLHRQVKEFCRARIELVTSSGKVSKILHTHFFTHKVSFTNILVVISGKLAEIF